MMAEAEKCLKVGFARVDITPPLGYPIAGYFDARYADGILDNLYVDAIAVSCGETVGVLISADLLGIIAKDAKAFRQKIGEDNGIPQEAIYLSCTHTHTGPQTYPEPYGDLEEKWLFYIDLLVSRLSDAVRLALEDRKPAKMGWAVTELDNIAYKRRFRMKDGTVRTNPGVSNPDIAEPVGEVDKKLALVRFVREGAGDVLLINFGVHSDTVTGNKFAADYPHYLRQALEGALEGVRCSFFCGAQGDVGAVDQMKARLFPREASNPSLARHMGHSMAGAVLQIYNKVKFTNVDSVSFGILEFEAPSNRAEESKILWARKIMELYEAGKGDEINAMGVRGGDEAMTRVTMVAEARRILQLEHGPDSFTLPISGVRIGEVAFVGIPGEPFTDIGVGIKKGSSYALTIPCCLVNGTEGYFPMRDSYDEGGYEAVGSLFGPRTAELLIENGLKMLSQLAK